MTDSPAPPKPRRSRLQFSLRVLLLGLTAFAIGFPIWYRWPFEEVEYKYPSPDPFAPPGASKTPYATITRTWRRTWGGGKVQSGRTVAERERGRFKTIEFFENGERHGLFESYFGGKLVRSGRYEHGKREGTWIDYSDDATCTAHWRQDLLDGSYEIAFKSGRKQQMNFSQGRLIDLNGQPVKNRLLEQLAAGSIDEPRIVKPLQNVMPVGMEFVETPLKDAIQYLQDQHDLPFVIDLRRVTDVDRPITVTTKGIDLCTALALLSAPRDLAFEYRYGVLRLTTEESAQVERDPTGVADIRPPNGSPMAQAWNEPCAIEAIEVPLDAALQNLAQPLAISFDLSGLPADSRTTPVTINLKNRPLRHVLALILDNLNLRAEARGNDTIAILPAESP